MGQDVSNSPALEGLVLPGDRIHRVINSQARVGEPDGRGEGRLAAVFDDRGGGDRAPFGHDVAGQRHDRREAEHECRSEYLHLIGSFFFL